MIERQTLEGQVADIEREIAALKTNQHFYEGQFTPLLKGTANAYDFSATFSTTNANINSAIFFSGQKQPLPLINIYFWYMDDTGAFLSSASWTQITKPIIGSASMPIGFQTTHSGVLASPGVVRVKFYVVATDDLYASQSWSVT